MTKKDDFQNLQLISILESNQFEKGTTYIDQHQVQEDVSHLIGPLRKKDWWEEAIHLCVTLSICTYKLLEHLDASSTLESRWKPLLLELTSEDQSSALTDVTDVSAAETRQPLGYL